MAGSGGLATVTEALAVIRRHVSRLPTTRVLLAEATGLTLAERVVCDMDYPPFDRAMMDGFAVRAADTDASGATFRVTGEVAAGAVPDRGVDPGEAVRINTGAPMPPGADAVVIIERVEVSTDESEMSTSETVASGRHVAGRGTAVRAGEVVLDAGMVLEPGRIAAAAAAGAAEVAVHRRPRLAVLVTGDELVEPGARPSGGQIRNSNGPTLTAAARQAGCEVVDLGTVGDDRAMLAGRITAGLEADVLCITGGVSMGRHDEVPDALADAGVRLELRKVAVKPGKPMVFGVGPARQAVFGLPGNPVSCFVCFAVFVRAALAAMQGRPVEPPTVVAAELGSPIKAAGARTECVPARWVGDACGRWQVTPTRWTGSGDPFGLARSNGLMIREAHAPAADAGTIVPVMPLCW